MPTKYLEKILKARVYDVAIETPLDVMRALSARLDNHVLLKREDLQPVFSFKLRGAYNKIVHLSAAQRAKGVIAASAGNHAQGVALAASRLGIQSLIVMPRTTPDIKVQSVRKLGGKAVLHGDTYDEAYGRAVSLADEKGMVFVHPCDDRGIARCWLYWIRAAASPTAWPCAGSLPSRSEWRASAATRSCWSAPMRSAPPSKTSSTTLAPSPHQPVRLLSLACCVLWCVSVFVVFFWWR